MFKLIMNRTKAKKLVRNLTQLISTKLGNSRDNREKNECYIVFHYNFNKFLAFFLFCIIEAI